MHLGKCIYIIVYDYIEWLFSFKFYNAISNEESNGTSEAKRIFIAGRWDKNAVSISWLLMISFI